MVASQRTQTVDLASSIVEPAAPAPKHDPVTPRYEILRCIGVGGMGVVYEARDRLKRAHVALKRLHSGSLDREHLSLAREFEALATLRHPNIVAVLDYGFTASAEPFLSLELLEGFARIDEAAVGATWSTRASWMLQALRALAYIHARGIVHRDVKPGNILVSSQTLKVLDFGIAIRPNPGEAPALAGTGGFIAPEVLAGGAPTPVSDLYALGRVGRKFLLDGVQLDDGTRARVAAFLDRLTARDPLLRHPTAVAAASDWVTIAGEHGPVENESTRKATLEAARFVGRTRELEALGEALKRTADGHGSTWVIEGPSGIGKTRLVDELRTLAMVAGFQVIVVQCLQEPLAPFAAWAEALEQACFDSPPTDQVAEVLAPLLPNIAELCGRALPAPPAPLPPRREDILTAIARVFSEQRRPTLLVVDDAHWSTDAWELVGYLAASVGRHRLMVLASYRTDDLTPSASLPPDVQRLELTALRGDEIDELGRAVLGVTNIEEVGAFLAEHADGNPLFVIEALRTLAEDAGSLRAVAGAPLPERFECRGIREAIAKRLAKVPEAVLPLLEWCSVAGRMVRRELLDRGLGEGSFDQLTRAVSDLYVLEVKGGSWRFAHDVFRECLLDRLPAAHRASVHASVASAIVAVDGVSGETAGMLAHHFGQAGDARQELECRSLAASHALSRGAYADAEKHLQRAFEIRKGVHDCEQDLQRLMTYGSVVGATRGWSDEAVRSTYDRAIELATRIERADVIETALHGMGTCLLLRGQLKDAEALGERSLALTSASGDPLALQQASLLLANVATWQGQHERANAFHEQLFRLHDEAFVPRHLARYGYPPHIMGAVTDAVSRCMQGDRALAQQRFESALGWAKAQPVEFFSAVVAQIGAWLGYLERDPQKAAHWAAELLAISRRHGFPMFVTLGVAFEAWADCQLRRSEQALDRLRAAARDWEAAGTGLAESLYAALLAEGLLVLGRPREAVTVAERALATPRSEERCYVPLLHLVRGDALSSLGDTAAANAYRAAHTSARQQGARLFEKRAALNGSREEE